MASQLSLVVRLKIIHKESLLETLRCDTRMAVLQLCGYVAFGALSKPSTVANTWRSYRTF